MTRIFAEGGLGMYPTLAFGLLQLAVGIAYALKPERRVVWTFAALGLVTFVCGALGLTLGAIATFLTVAKLPEAQQYGVTLLGLSESLLNLALALLLIVLATLALAVGALRAALAAGPERS